MCFATGTFLIPYMLMLTLVGMPLFLMELAVGQFASCRSLTMWKINPLFKGRFKSKNLT